jgi:5-histidylcysteine sulfoxide synthase/putative 4-mercaptohistidine N1-methyltranferase
MSQAIIERADVGPAVEADQLYGPRPSWWWTGADPRKSDCPGRRADGAVGSLPLIRLDRCSRGQAFAYFANGWVLTEILFSSVQGEASFMRSPYHRLRHPMIFYYGHVACLFVNKLRVAGLLDAGINPTFERIFEVGVDEMSWDDMSRTDLEWPSVREVCEYRRTAFGVIAEIINSHPDLADGHAPIGWDHPLWALFMAMEHERIHLETSSVLLREMPLSLLRAPEFWPPAHPSAHDGSAQLDQVRAEACIISADGGEIRTGKPLDWPTFGWDNEYGEDKASVSPFRVSASMVTNGEFLEFVRDGGYREQRFWTKTGWQWRTFRNVKSPTFWVANGPAGSHLYQLRTIFSVVDLPLTWPVCVNFHEAKAWLRWKSERDGRNYRLPSAAEHTWLRNPGIRVGDSERAVDAVMDLSSDAMAKARSNLNLAFASECPADWAEASPDGVYDLGGNVWDWCEDDFYPLKGFRVHTFYDDFSTPCFDGQHSMILGGSFVSTGDEASVWARFHFRPHFFQHAGFRIVEQASGECNAIHIGRRAAGGGDYESSEALSQYMTLHFGTPMDAVPHSLRKHDLHDFARHCADYVAGWAKRLNCGHAKAIDVGCSVGGGAFALGRHFDKAVGVDLSTGFIDAAERLRRDGSMSYPLRIEGSIYQERLARVPADIERSRVEFRRADACSLPAEYFEFNAVMAVNLLCRLASPMAFLDRLAGPRGLVAPGGVVMIATPFTWNESFTIRSGWLGGYEKDGAPRWSLEQLMEIMGRNFVLVHRDRFALTIREHARKFELIEPDVLIWQHQR